MSKTLKGLRAVFMLSSLIFLFTVTGFLALTYRQPWEMIFAERCGESPVGFYRLGIVYYEFTDYNGGEVQTWALNGGPWEFIKFYFGAFDPCTGKP